MELNNRIVEIMEKSGLTPSEFADKIEVQRSAISHITSGRNKPSLEFLIKIKNSFPEIDTDWLVFGIENEEELSEESEGLNENPDHPTLFKSSEFQQENLIPEKISFPKKEFDPSLKFENHPKSSNRNLVKTLLFYDDGSFEEFNKFNS